MTAVILLALYTLSALFLSYKVYGITRKDGIDPTFKENCIAAAIILLPTNMFIAAMIAGMDVHDWVGKRKEKKS